jgi:hypothetical protein
MALNRDTLELVQSTACDAEKADVIAELNSDGRTAYVKLGKEIKTFVLPPAVRKHTVHSLDDLIAYATKDGNTAPVVWHGGKGATLLLDDADRRDVVVFPLTESRRFAKLRELVAAKPFLDQTAFVRLLRVELGMDNELVVKQFRKLSFKMDRGGEGEVNQGLNRLSKSVVAEVRGVDDLPDELSVEVPVYQQSGERQPYLVKCAIEIDSVNERFQLIPLPDELERVVDLAQASIRGRLETAVADKKIPVYYGEP